MRGMKLTREQYRGMFISREGDLMFGLLGSRCLELEGTERRLEALSNTRRQHVSQTLGLQRPKDMHL